MGLAFIQHGPTTALLFLASYVAANMVLGNVVEPMWMGKRLGLSTTVVFLSLLVWGEIWGPVGMLLSVPLTMVIKIMLENSEDYAFVAALLSESADEPAPDGDEPDAAPDDGNEPRGEPYDEAAGEQSNATMDDGQQADHAQAEQESPAGES